MTQRSKTPNSVDFDEVHRIVCEAREARARAIASTFKRGFAWVAATFPLRPVRMPWLHSSSNARARHIFTGR